jgi:diadenosine tetraphosphate (Ap4A) HIT family hydrolase
MNDFLNLPTERRIGETHHFFLIWDCYPVSPGHLLIISKKLRKDYFDLTFEEQTDLPLAIELAKELITQHHQTKGFNIGMNCGETAGQTIFHFHCHIIPRYNGDMSNPRGGVRHCVAGKGDYFP